MKRLLLPLLATLALPTAVSAETVWLVINHANTAIGVAFEKIEMKDMAQCLEQGEIYRSTKIKYRDNSTQGMAFPESTSFICLKGK